MKYLRPILIIFVLLIVLFLVVSVAGKYVEAPTLPNQTGTSTEPDVTSGNRSLTYSFEVTLPTPCHQLSEPDILIRESYPEQIAVQYQIVPPAAGVMCAQVITTKQVSNTIQIPTSAIFTSISVDGKSVPFTTR